MRLGTWNVRRLFSAGSRTAAARESARYKLDLVGVQAVKWEKGVTIKAGDKNFFYGKGNDNDQLGTEFFVHHRIVSAVMRVEFVNYRLSFIVLMSLWCNVVVTNVHATSEEKSDDQKNSFKDLKQAFITFLSTIQKLC
jgi:hypothetical protein